MALNEEIRPTQNRRGLSRPRKANLHTWLNSFSSKSDSADHKRRRTIATYIGFSFSVAIAALAIFVLIHTLAHINLANCAPLSPPRRTRRSSRPWG